MSQLLLNSGTRLLDAIATATGYFAPAEKLPHDSNTQLSFSRNKKYAKLGSVVIESDADLKLGGEANSASLVIPVYPDDSRLGLLWTGSQVLSALPPGQHPFVQLIFVAYDSLPEPRDIALGRLQIVRSLANVIPGYMATARAGTTDLSALVHREHRKTGITYHHFAGALTTACSRLGVSAQRISIAIAAGSQPLLALVLPLVESVNSVRLEAQLARAASRMLLAVDCDRGGACGECSEQEICNRVQQIVDYRRKTNEC